MEKYKIVLVAGAINSGKDTVCEFLEQAYGFKKIAFADKVRELCMYLLDDLYGCQVTYEHLVDRKLKESFILTKNDKRWVANGTHLTYRQFMRLIATDCLRDKIQKTTWADYVKKQVIEVISSHQRLYNGVCISDWRFPNEYDTIDSIMENFGKVVEIITVYIDREDTSVPDNDHIEGLLKNFKFDFYLKNDSTLESLFKKVDKLITGSYLYEKVIEEEKKRGSLKFNELI